MRYNGAVSDRRRAVVQAREAWPTVHIDDDDFLAYVAARLEGDNVDHLADLYLACGCERRDPAALAAFDSRYMPNIARVLAKVRLDDVEIDEVQQLIRQVLFVGENGPPRIGAYSGTGPLGAWLRTVAIRVGLDFLRRVKRERDQRDLVLEEAVLDGQVDVGPEIELLKRTCGDDLRAAFTAGLAQLSPDEQLILRFHYVDGLSTARIGAITDQHSVTVLRKLGRTRERLLGHIKKSLRERLGISDAQLESLVRLVKSDFHMTLSRVLTQG